MSQEEMPDIRSNPNGQQSSSPDKRTSNAVPHVDCRDLATSIRARDNYPTD